MSPSLNLLLGLLATLPHYCIAQASRFPVPFLEPLLEERQASTVPDYVTTYAPLVWLHSAETYFPGDIAAQLANTVPEINFKPLTGYPKPLTLNNLAELNSFNGTQVYLTSTVDITTNPAWLNGVRPDSAGRTEGATSMAVIVNDRGGGEVDAFYMYFYPFNWGGVVFGENVDDHVGDWEHNMIRFQNGKPSQVWFSQHGFGQAFTYACLEKHGVRPVAYSGNGSHANYAIAGDHDHTIPNLDLPDKGLLTDFTDQGTLWDPLLGAYFYSYNPSANTYTPYDPSYPSNWLSYLGKWGDQQYLNSDPRQHEIIPGVSATARYSGGPTGPEDKQLSRSKVCPTSNEFICIVHTKLVP